MILVIASLMVVSKTIQHDPTRGTERAMGINTTYVNVIIIKKSANAPLRDPDVRAG